VLRRQENLLRSGGHGGCACPTHRDRHWLLSGKARILPRRARRSGRTLAMHGSWFPARHHPRRTPSPAFDNSGPKERAGRPQIGRCPRSRQIELSEPSIDGSCMKEAGGASEGRPFGSLSPTKVGHDLARVQQSAVNAAIKSLETGLPAH